MHYYFGNATANTALHRRIRLSVCPPHIVQRTSIVLGNSRFGHSLVAQPGIARWPLAHQAPPSLTLPFSMCLLVIVHSVFRADMPSPQLKLSSCLDWLLRICHTREFSKKTQQNQFLSTRCPTKRHRRRRLPVIDCISILPSVMVGRPRPRLPWARPWPQLRLPGARPRPQPRPPWTRPWPRASSCRRGQGSST